MRKQHIKHPIRMIRLLAGITLDDIFMETGIQPPKLSRLERGIIRPTDKEVVSLGKALNVPPGDLFLDHASPLRDHDHE